MDKFTDTLCTLSQHLLDAIEPEQFQIVETFLNTNDGLVTGSIDITGSHAQVIASTIHSILYKSLGSVKPEKTHGAAAGRYGVDFSFSSTSDMMAAQQQIAAFNNKLANKQHTFNIVGNVARTAETISTVPDTQATPWLDLTRGTPEISFKLNTANESFIRALRNQEDLKLQSTNQTWFDGEGKPHNRGIKLIAEVDQLPQIEEAAKVAARLSPPTHRLADTNTRPMARW